MGTQRIKGITIEIGGNTQPLVKSLADVDKKISSTKSALRDVERLLKFDPKNTELLSQKQKLLGEAVTNTKERLERLKAAQKDVTDPVQYDALQREIIATEGDLKNLESQLQSLSTTQDTVIKDGRTGFEKIGDAISNAGSKVKAAGQKIGAAGKAIMPVSAGVTAIGAASIAAAKDVDKGYDTIITKTGATGKTLEGLQDQMERVFSEVPTDAETAGVAIGEVNTRFGLLGDELGDVSKQFVQFAEINGTDLNNAIDNVDSVMTKFGVDTKDVGSVLGIMTKAGQDTGVSMDSLFAALEKNGSTLKGMNLSLPESISLLAQFESSGVESATALTALRKAQQYATKNGIPLNKSLKETVKAIQSAHDNTEAMTIATERFGSKGAAEMVQAIREERLDLTDLNKSLGDYKDTVKDTYEATLDPWDEMQTSVNQLKVAGTELAGELFKELSPIIKQVAQAVKDATTWFKGLDEGQKQLIVRIGLVVAAAGPALIAIGKVVESVGLIMEYGGPLVKGIGGLIGKLAGGGGLTSALGSVGSAIGSAVAALGPWGIAIAAAIAAAVAIGVAVYKNWDKIKAWTKDMVKNVKKRFEDFKKSISKTWENVKSATSKAWNGIKTGVTNGVNSVRNAVSTGMTKVRTVASTAWTKVRSVTSSAWGGIKSAVTNGVNAIRNGVSNGMAKVKTVASNAWANVKNRTSSSWSSIKATVSGAISSVRSVASGGFTAIKTTASNAWSNLRSGAQRSFSALRSTVANSFHGVYNAITSPLRNAYQAVRNVVSRIKNAFKFRISLPKIRLPHITVRWLKVGNFLKIPRMSVDWYKKAYDNPMLFNSPTVLQTPYGAKGFGDGNGGELVYGHKQLMRDIAEASSGMNVTINITQQPGQDATQLANIVSRKLAQLQKQKEAVYA